MKRYIATVLIGLVLALLLCKLYTMFCNSRAIYKDGNVSYISMVDSKNFYIYKAGKWQKIFIKGVNIGAGKPGYFPGEFGITKEDYLRWFKYIEGMNANSIRVYTRLMPEFYEALYE
jgi:hypothetical protein